jgi:peptide chain release factor 1
MADPAVISDGEQYRKVSKSAQRSDRSRRQVPRLQAGAEDELESGEGHAGRVRSRHARTGALEVERVSRRMDQIEQDLKILLLPKDPLDEKDVVLEIRAGTGGDEASLFAAEVFRMYTRYAETQRWKVEVTSVSESAVGGLKEVLALISGNKVYSR